jgi:hypothetical protein
MSRIGIAISGGPNPAEIIDLVILAESLGYESRPPTGGDHRVADDPRPERRHRRAPLGAS